ncbi:MAG: hypothetical protein P5697_23955 [Limnospira sp. PMC 1256.20]|uniref:hypothetical protein n=2 Tax=Limnospira TaxID=2596745 RepID=UPI0028E169F3|nr:MULTISPECIES: hypothetical protein [unclassified Limnospira]MDT9211386.1 hypothetical protein [Limnospira sp. PMC 1252.20]MDT9216490.1 hypothetical protein [Limnospira sp. PMC 1256.20]MDT9257271.1 hypothetical protein [Limnospira sp. PMC 1254.20]MDT9262367.1 hypothetical protein [Limnospira sp. PMC 1236.20]MDT9282829.1 hypothetical protein [Limnospira sp. PMC 1293.21]
MGFPATNSATQKPPFSTPQPIPRRNFLVVGWRDRFTQHSRTLVGWLARSLYTTQSARLGARSLYTTQSDSSRLAGAIAKPNTVG